MIGPILVPVRQIRAVAKPTGPAGPSRTTLRRLGLRGADAALGRWLEELRDSPRYARVTRLLGKAMR